MKETTRLMSIPSIFRIAMVPIKYGDYTIPAGLWH